MGRSGSVDFAMTASDIIKKALALVADRAAEIPLTNSEITDGLQSLNILVKAFQGQGLHLWKRDEGILFLDAGVNSYLLGPQGAEATLAKDFINTELSVAAIATATTLTVDSTTGMTAGDFIGIELDDNTRQWTTIVSVDSSTGLTITDALTGAAGIDKTIFTFTTILERPLRVESSRRATIGNDSDIELNKWSRQQYFAQVNKSSQGTPTNFYYTPSLDNGEIFIWQTASNVKQVVKFTFERTIEDFDSTANNPDFPIEWSRALIWNLALDIGPEYSTPEPKMARIERKAAEYLDNMLGWDEEMTSLNIQPSFRRG